MKIIVMVRTENIIRIYCLDDDSDNEYNQNIGKGNENDLDNSTSNEGILDIDQLHATVTPPSELYDQGDVQHMKSKNLFV
jgi:hypothetical protein